VPEGDSIFRAARTLNQALAGKVVVRFESMLPLLNRVHEDHPLTGRTIDSVKSVGKHLLMQFSGGLTLRTHMRMSGSWHIYRPGEPWQRPRRDMRIVLATSDFEAVGFNIPVAELIRDSRVASEMSRAVGPDLLDEVFDAGEALHRLRAQATSEIGDALLNQRAMAGVGNVYKSETLFSARINPFIRVEQLTDDQLADIIETARKLLRVNVTAASAPLTTYIGLRRTTGRDGPDERLWVYGRARRPCRRCGTAIQVRKQGRDARLTYWCETCQPS